MRVPVYIVCAALVVAVNSEDNYYGKQNALPLALSEEQETLGFLIPRLMAKFRANRQWNGGLSVSPYYPIADIDSNNIDNQETYSEEGRSKRAGMIKSDMINRPSLSISNSLDVLRNRLLLEISRKNALEGMNRNRGILCKIGKRGLFDSKRKCDDETEKFIEDKLIK